MAMSHTHAEPLDQGQVGAWPHGSGQGVADGVGGCLGGGGRGKIGRAICSTRLIPSLPLHFYFSPIPVLPVCEDFPFFVRFTYESEDAPRGGYRVFGRDAHFWGIFGLLGG